jgi:calcineurin-like phosphoesterase family protein
MRARTALFLIGTTIGTALASGPMAAAVDEPVRFAVIGDNGTGKTAQYDIAARLIAARQTFPYQFVLMLGDNMYGSQRPEDFVDKFARPYGPLLQSGVPFYAALGNHDQPTNRDYRPFNMNGERFYTFVKGPVRFVVFDTNAMDAGQLAWIDTTLNAAREPWKIAYFHHPLYSDGDRHGSDMELRALLEPLLVRHGVTAVFAGHEHIYQRLRPQRGITHFVEGSSGQLRKGGVTPSALSAAAYADDQTFMLVEITGDRLSFRTLSRTGRVVDSGDVTRVAAPARSQS